MSPRLHTVHSRAHQASPCGNRARGCTRCRGGGSPQRLSNRDRKSSRRVPGPSTRLAESRGFTTRKEARKAALHVPKDTMHHCRGIAKIRSAGRRQQRDVGVRGAKVESGDVYDPNDDVCGVLGTRAATSRRVLLRCRRIESIVPTPVPRWDRSILVTASPLQSRCVCPGSLTNP